ncbi:MAG TPA: hypothetical protein VE775_03620, partial [Pyrinomonadaceae bacterium]|nr:hypothetical protein [Pyrinomonadaceae bacterium]
MRLALFGHGAMGQLVEARAHAEGHEIALVLTAQDAARGVGEMAGRLRGLDAAIDFTVAGAVLDNVRACASAGVPVVVGTTGWREQEAEVRRVVA